jgi:gas vesicle protein
MNGKHDNDNGNERLSNAFVAGLSAGVVIGAGVGLLFAPRQGAELRGQIRDSASAAGKRASDTITAIADTGRDTYRQVRDVAATAGDELGRMAEDFGLSAERGVAAIRNAATRPRRSDNRASRL